MRKTANKRKKVQMPAGIRNKMMAAISMLMVSCIMLVSSTYAWFTLSTAPEVTGITTNVGANGNLEMMLLTGSSADGVTMEGSFYSEADDLGVISQVGDSMAHQSVTEANVTWGNLVDLSDGSYGLGNIVLSPARLNATAGGDAAKDSIGTTILNAPSYGTDGRVIDVKTATYTGKYTDAGTYAYDDAHRGVRVIGTTTDVSQRLAAYRAAKGAVTTNISAAKNKATSSLLANGQSLANVLVGYAAGTKTTFSDADLKVFLTVFRSLEGATGSAASAIKSAVLAYSLSDANDAEITDTVVSELSTAIEAVTITSTASFDSVPNAKVPAEAAAAITTYLDTNSTITNAINSLYALNKDLDTSEDTTGKYTYEQISPILNLIVNKKYVEIAGQTDLGKDDINAVIQEFTKNGSITMTMLNNSGVYADIATLVGNFTVSGLTVHVEYGTGASALTADVPIIMQTNVSGEGVPQIPAIGLGNAPKEEGQAANSVLSNTYGYALDFGFRTNAAASNLLLQTAAVNRVYTDQTDDTLRTQGSGSFMQFTSSDVNNFTAEDVLALMSAIRVAFVSPAAAGGGEILAMGALDITSTTDQNGVTTYTKGESVKSLEGGYKSGLFLHDYEVGADGIITLGAKQDDKSVITALTQNKASKITVIVYLDGDIVDNSMVANANTSMTGVMNIQFSSSATLAPMENTGMRTGGATGEVVTFEKVLATSGANYTIGEYSGTVKDGYTIYEGSDGEVYFSNNGVSYTKLTTSNYHNVLSVTVSETQEPDPTV